MRSPIIITKDDVKAALLFSIAPISAAFFGASLTNWLLWPTWSMHAISCLLGLGTLIGVAFSIGKTMDWWDRRNPSRRLRIQSLEEEKAIERAKEIIQLTCANWNDIWTFECDHPLVKEQMKLWEKTRKRGTDAYKGNNSGDSTIVHPNGCGNHFSRREAMRRIRDLDAILEKRVKRNECKNHQ